MFRVCHVPFCICLSFKLNLSRAVMIGFTGDLLLHHDSDGDHARDHSVGHT